MLTCCSRESCQEGDRGDGTDPATQPGEFLPVDVYLTSQMIWFVAPLSLVGGWVGG